jgi:hypothetical protein
LFSENNLDSFEIQIPPGTTSIEHYVTSDNANENFSLVTTDNFDLQSGFISVNIDSMSMHSLVFNIDSSLAVNDFFIGDTDQNSIGLYPNPVVSQLNLRFPNKEQRQISIYQLNGAIIYDEKLEASKTYSIDIKAFAEGMYILRSSTKSEKHTLNFLKINP